MFARALKVLLNDVALAAAATVLLAPPTSAQARRGVEVAPAVGAYLPTGNLPPGAVPLVCVETHPTPNTDDCAPFSMRAKQAVAVGGRVTAWLSNRGAIEGSFWYSPSGVVSGFVVKSERAGNFGAAALRFVLNLAPHAPTMSALVMGGPVIAVHDGPTSFGGVLGFALDMRPKRRLGVRAQIEDYVYGELAQDFVVSLSISPFGQRGDRR